MKKAHDGLGPCPACRKLATYDRTTDRYSHLDGTDNRPCWLRITRRV